ncbi:MFS transporter [Calothrix sp. CCY 0018]|uniref:MFS transporter n=1 Tax=Calothrix sp. CCY 0018 TaxID=3103864 RepID=UPI0039C66F3B
MNLENISPGLRKFFIVWLGQFVSTIGSSMTSFAIEIWAWEITGKATTLTLVGFFGLLPRLIIAPISGIIVDRYNRKLLMILGDTVAVISTFFILLLYLNNQLQIWHLYLISAINGTFNQFQYLAYSASIALMVPKQHYTRVSSMDFISGYGSNILAPPLAGYLYKIVGLTGIAGIDIITFLFAITSILLIKIPQLSQTDKQDRDSENTWSKLGFGLHYIFARKGLLALLIANLLFWLPHDIGDSVYAPMILSRTNNDTFVLGNLAAAAGFGGVTGAVIISTWGGFRRKIKGVLFGMIGAGLSKIVFGLGRNPWIWVPAQFCSSLNFPLNGSSDDAIWLTKVAPYVQGRVFAARSLILQLLSALGLLIAGPLADNVFTPMLNNKSIFGGIFGIGKGAGIAMLYVISAVCMLLVGVIGFTIPSLRNVESTVADHDIETLQQR